MRKSDLLLLEKVFAKEIEGSFLQSKNKALKRLEEDGYVQEVTLEIGGGWSKAIVKGYILTILGSVTYCSSDLCKGDFE